MTRRPSLRRLLLVWLLPAMVALVTAGGITAYAIALRSATRAYDRALLDTALAIAGQIQIVGGVPVLNLPNQAEEILLTDRYDQVYFEVLGPENNFVAGHRGLPPPPWGMEEDGRLYYDGWYGGHSVRMAAFFTEQEGVPLVILAAETQNKRNSLAHEILLSMLLPEVLLVVATLGLGWVGIRHGLKPVEDLRSELARRSHHDLSTVSTDQVPEEITPLVEELNHLLARLEASLTAQRHFVSDAAHQLRTPLAALQAQAELALREVDGPKTREEQRQQLQRILSATQRLTHLTHQLLALARAEPGGQQSMEAVDLADIARESAETWLPLALRANVDLGFDLAPATVSGARLLVQELLANLIDNAIRYTPRGGSINVRCFNTAEGARLQVEDSGPGIPPEDRERVFERFQRRDSEHTDGCGLGLAIVREIARQHQAEVTISSSPNLGGALFEVRFPPA